MKTPKEASKCREWEKVRRDKLNKSFTTLSKLLPNHDPSLTISKIEILQKATIYIEELQQKLKDVLTADGVKKAEGKEIKDLYERIKKLLLRNELLSNLLKDAGIRIPSEYGGIKDFKEPLRWSNKITPEQAKELADKEAQKENKKEITKSIKKPKLKNVLKKTVKHQKKDTKQKLKIKRKKSGVINVKLSNIMPIVRQQNFTKVSSQPCFIIASNPPINLPRSNKINKSASTVVTNSSSLVAPKMASIIAPPTSAIVPKVNSTLSSLGPGTLILANGNIVPILPQPTAVLPAPTILTKPTPIILKPPTNNTTLIVMPSTTPKEIKSTNSITSSCSTILPTKTFARIRPKFGVTKTTQVNKVPIPALTSRYSQLCSEINEKPGVKTNQKVVEKKLTKKRKLAKSINVEKNKLPKIDNEKNLSENDQIKVIENVTVAEKCNNEEIKVPLKDKMGVELSEKPTELEKKEENVKEKESCSKVVPVETKIMDSKDCTDKAEPVIIETPIIEPPVTKENTATDTNEIRKETIENKQIEVKISSDNTVLTKPDDKQSNDKDKIPTTTTEIPASKPISLPENNHTTEIQDKNLELGMNLNHSELSNDIFSSLQVPIGGQNPESTSPTAAFLLAFPLVSSLTGVKVTEVIEEENSDSRHGTPTLLQIGTMDTTKTTQSVHTESLTPNLLNLDNFSFFSGKDMCNNFYSNFDNANVYPVLDNQKNSNYGKDLNPKPTKLINATTVPPKQQKEIGVGTNAHVLTSESATKVVQNSFIRQNSSGSYAKLATSYGGTMSNNNMNYDARQKMSSATTTASPIKDMNATTYSSPSTRKNPDVIQCSSNYNTTTSNVVSVAQCNTYNPFSDFSKSSTVHSYSTFTKPYSDPLYTNSTHYNYPQTNGNNFEQGMYYPKSKTTYGGTNYPDPSYSMDCKGKREPPNPRHNPINYYNQTKTPKEKFKGTKPASNQPKAPINWMTTPDFRSQPNSEYLVPPPFTKDIDYNPNSFYPSNSFAATTHTSYFNTSATMYQTPEFQNADTNRKSFDSALPIISSTSSAQRNEFEENQFSWSPTKLPQFLETPHSFVSSTLPTLVGDLALGTTQPTFSEQKLDPTGRDVKPKETRRSKVHPVNYESNFLSVSQLVENKTDLNSSRTNRRNNRNVKNKPTKHSHKPTETKELEATNQTIEGIEKPIKQLNYTMQGVNANWIGDCNKTNRHGHKNPQSSYSAEALIGHQDQSESSSVPKQRYRQQQANYNKAIPIPTFLSDNIVPYFPPVEIPQENFIQPNPNYQTSTLAHSFPTSVQNNAYTSGTYISTGATITSSYLQNSCLIPEFNHDYSGAISDNSAVIPEKVVDNKHCNRNEIKQTNHTSRTEQQINTDCSANTSNFMKKTKHKHGNESNLPGIVDFGFLSMPSTINSPILPDDFHAHSNFLPPPTPSQLYPCKNPLYPKQTADLNSGSILSLPPVPVSRNAPQHFESTTASNVSSSLTSFNLSAIFPEINKGPVPLPGLYTEPPRNKGYNFQRNYLGGSVQVSFSNKSTTSSNYVNSVATSYAPTN